jgi:hypothetical protein
MKIRTLVAASALAATGAIGAMSHSASAGCGISLDVNNNVNTDVTVNWNLSKVRAAPLGVAGTWSSIGSTSVTLDADTSGSGDELTKALNLTFSCGTARQYKLYVTDGNGNSWYEYHNEVGPTGSWTTSVQPYIDIE